MGAHGFRCSFTPLSGCFSPFPHGTCSLSVMGECSALEGGPPCFGPGFTCPALLGDAPRSPRGSAYGALTRCGRPSHAVPLPLGFVTPPERAGSRDGSPRNPRAATPCRLHVRGFGLSPVSLAATPGVSVDFLSSGYLDVSVPPVASSHLISFGCGQQGMTPAGFPHSGIPGSKAVCASPGLIAACRALLRLPMPRHPPCARGIFFPRSRGSPPGKCQPMNSIIGESKK